MLRSTIFSTISGSSFDHIDNSQIIDEILVTLATGSEASTAIVDIALNKAQASGWRSRFAKLDKSILIWEERQTATGVVRNTHYAGFIDKVSVEGVSNGGVTLSIRLSDPAELLKMIQLSADKTYKAATWTGIIKQIVADAFSQPNTPNVTIEGGMEPGETVTFKAEAGAEGTTYSALIEEVKEASNGGYAEVAFTPKPQESQGQLTGVTWTATAKSELINLSKTVDIEDDENVYGFTIDADSNSNFSRLVVKNAEGARKTYTNPNGGTLLSDDVLSVDADEADFDAIAAAYMKSENLATSESHEVGVKMKLADVRGTVGAVGVLPKAVEYDWSTSTRLRVVQAEYRIGVTTKAWNGLGSEEAAIVPVDLTFAPISNKTWVPPSRANSDNTNQDWIDKNKYSGVGRDSFSGAHPGDYGGGSSGGGEGGGTDPGTPEAPGSGNPVIPDFEADPWWSAGSENMPDHSAATGRERPLYGFDMSDPLLTQPVSISQGVMPGPLDSATWTQRYSSVACHGQSHDGSKVYWCYWSQEGSNTRRTDGRLEVAFNKIYDVGFTARVHAPTSLIVCSADLVEGEFLNPTREVEFVVDDEIINKIILGIFLVGTEGDYEKFQELGVEDGLISNPTTDGWTQLPVGAVFIRGIFTTEDRVILMVESLVIEADRGPSWRYNTIRTLTFMKGEDGRLEPDPGIRALSSGGAVKFMESKDVNLSAQSSVFFDSVFRAGKTWFGAANWSSLNSNSGKSAAVVFNLYHRNSIDPTSYNNIPSLFSPTDTVPEVYGWRSAKVGFAVAKSTKGSGMSLYANVSHASGGGYGFNTGLWEFRLANNMLAGRTRGEKWRRASVYPDTYEAVLESGATKVMSGVQYGTITDASRGSTTVELLLPTGYVPYPEGTSPGYVTNAELHSGESESFTDESAGYLPPTVSEHSLVTSSRQFEGGYYHDGYLYFMVFGGTGSTDVATNAGEVVNAKYWWLSIKVTPRTKPKTQTSNWKTMYSDIPLNPGARGGLWSPPEPRYEHAPKPVEW